MLSVGQGFQIEISSTLFLLDYFLGDDVSISFFCFFVL